MVQIYDMDRKILQDLTRRIQQFSSERTGVLAPSFRKSDAINVN